MLIDIHSHILPTCDDGAKDIEASITLLKMMKAQGITDVIATPHFYPSDETIEDFKERVSVSYKNLLNADINDLPNIYLGCELFYYKGITKSEYIEEFTLNKSKYILLEPNPYFLDKAFMSELLYLKNELGITPIIPHIERYDKSKGYKYFLKFIKENKILTQVNTSSFFNKAYNKTVKKLFSEHLVTFVATDTHSLNRPPMMDSALSVIENQLSQREKKKILYNLELLYDNIIVKENLNEIKHPKYL